MHFQHRRQMARKVSTDDIMSNSAKKKTPELHFFLHAPHSTTIHSRAFRKSLPTAKNGKLLMSTVIIFFSYCQYHQVTQSYSKIPTIKIEQVLCSQKRAFYICSQKRAFYKRKGTFCRENARKRQHNPFFLPVYILQGWPDS